MAVDALYKVQIDTSGAEAGLGRLRSSLASVFGGASDKKVKVDTTGAEAGVRGLRDELGRFKKASDSSFDTKNVDKFGGAIGDLEQKAASSLGSLAGKAAAAFGAGAIVKLGSDFEAGTKELQAITGVAGQALDDMSSNARKAAVEMGFSAQSFLTVDKTLISRLGPGIASSTAGLDQMARSIATLSRATGDTLEASVDAATTGLLQFGVSLEDPVAAAQAMNEQINIMAKGAQLGAAEVPQIADAIKVAGVAMSGANVSFAETNSLLQALAAGGKFGAEAGTALRNVAGKLEEGRFLPKDVQKELQAAGVDIAKLSDKSLSFADRLNELKKISGDAALVTKLFGTENASAANILLRSTESVKTMTGELTKGAAAQEQAAIRQETFAFQMEKLQAIAAEVGISLFQLFQPVLSGLVTAGGVVAEFIGDIVNFVGESEALTTALGAGLAVVVGLLAAGAAKQFFGNFVTGSIQAALSIVQRLIPSLVTQTVATGAATTAQLGLNTAMLASPAGIIIGSIVALGAAYAVFAASQETIGDATESVNKAFSEFNKATDDLVKTQKASDNVKKLADEYDRLSKSKAPEDQKRLAEVTKELDKATEGAGISVDEYGRAIEANTDKVRQFADEQLRLSEQMRNEAWQNMLDRAASLGDKFVDARKEAKELRDQLNSGDVANFGTQVTAFFDGILGTNAAAKDLVANGKALREELSQSAEEQLKAQEALVPVIAQYDRALKGVATVQQVMSQFNIREKDAAVQLLQLAREKNEAAAAGANAEDKTNKSNAAAARTRKERQESELAKIKEMADAAARELEIARRLERLKAGQAFSAQDELDVENKRQTVLQTEIKAREAILAKLKETGKAAVVLSESEIKTLELEAKIKLDTRKAQADLQTAVDSLRAVEIEVGIRPREEGLTQLDDLIARTARELQDAKGLDLSLLTPQGIAEAERKVAELQARLLSLTSQRTTRERELNDELVGLRIDGMSNETDREIAELEEKYNAETEFVRRALASGRDLSERERELARLLEQKHLRELNEIRGKAYKEDLDLKKQFEQLGRDAILDGMRELFKKQEDLSKAEADKQRLELDDRRGALERERRTGAIGERRYQVELAKLTEDRVKLEEELERSASSKLGQAKDSVLQSLLGKMESYFVDLSLKYGIDAFAFAASETSKTAAATTGTATRVGLNETESASNISTAGSSMLGAWAETLKGWSTIPFVGVLLGIAQAGLMMAAFAGIRSLLGYEHGGAVVGEKGPELIFPGKDASNLVTGLISNTVRATREALGQQGAGGPVGRQGRTRIDVRGELTTRGRDLKYSITRDDLARRTERLAAA